MMESQLHKESKTDMARYNIQVYFDSLTGEGNPLKVAMCITQQSRLQMQRQRNDKKKKREELRTMIHKMSASFRGLELLDNSQVNMILRTREPKAILVVAFETKGKLHTCSHSCRNDFPEGRNYSPNLFHLSPKQILLVCWSLSSCSYLKDNNFIFLGQPIPFISPLYDQNSQIIHVPL